MFQFCCGVFSGFVSLLMFMFFLRILYDGMVDISLLEVDDIVETIKYFGKELFKKEVITNVYYPFV